MLPRLFRRCAQLGPAVVRALGQRPLTTTKPAEQDVVAGTLAYLVRSRPALAAENAFLPHQRRILRRSAKRPRCTPTDRALLVLLASRLRARRHAPPIVQPETLLRWRRQGFRLFWRRNSRPRSAPQPKVAAETTAPIPEMAAANVLWGAERIRGELLQLDIRVANTATQRRMRSARPPRRVGQPRGTVLRNHAGEIWTCDILPITDLLLRPLLAFFAVALRSRSVTHAGVTRQLTDAWVTPQLREATPLDQRPKYLIRDNDSKYGPAFARVAASGSIMELRTAYRAPRQNAACERFLGTMRRECLDHILVLCETHLRRILRKYVEYFNHDRPHRGLQQHIPGNVSAPPMLTGSVDNVRAFPVLGGLHLAYWRAA
jgi:transposase InsO family protein